MKKQIGMLVMLIVVLITIINLSSCKKKDSDPQPGNKIPCGIQKFTYLFHYNTYGSDTLFMSYRQYVYPGVSKFKLQTTATTGTVSIQPQPSVCDNDARRLYGSIYNKDSTFFKAFDLYTTPGDTVVFEVNN